MPAGLVARTNSQIETDLRTPVKNAISTIAAIRVLMWLVAALIIGAVAYLSAIDRVRDFAVLKAVGGSSRTLAMSLMLQAVLAALLAALIAVGLARLMTPTVTIPVVFQGSAVLLLLAVAAIVGVLSSLVRAPSGRRGRSGTGLRRLSVTALRIQDLVIEYVQGGYIVRPIDGLDFSAEDGELVILLGPSGSGKTTLLSCLASLLRPTEGTILVGSTEVTRLGGAELEQYRRGTVGIVFQSFNLVPSLTARENVAAPLRLAGVSRADAYRRADELLERVGLSERAGHLPSRMSGGQQQRAAIARALVHDPPLIVADEPTAHLDFVQVEECSG
jgi:ABC-type lipoprotein export system ATPase subunit